MFLNKLNFFYPDEQDFINFLINNQPVYISILENEIKILASIFYFYYQNKIITSDISNWNNDFLIKFYDVSEYYKYWINGDLNNKIVIDEIGDFNFSGDQKSNSSGLENPDHYDKFNFKKSNLLNRLNILKNGSKNQIKSFLNEFYYFFINDSNF